MNLDTGPVKKAVVIFDTRYGNTENVAKAVAKGIHRSAVEAACFNIDDGQHMLPRGRRDLYKELKDAYKLRSAIVHGNTEEESSLLLGSSWEEKIGTVRRHDREAIKLFFRHGCLYDRRRRRDFLNSKLLFEGPGAIL